MFTTQRNFSLISGMLLIVTGILLLSQIEILAKPGDGTLLTYKSGKGDILEYESIRHTIRSMERDGTPSETTTKKEFVFQLKTEKADSQISFVLTVKNFRYSSEGRKNRRRPALDPDQIIGKQLRLKIDHRGKLKELSPISQFPVSSNFNEGQGRGRQGRINPLNQFSVNFFQLPVRAIQVGESWTEPYTAPPPAEADFSRRFANNQKTQGQVTYTVVGWESKMGLQCLHIKIAAEYTRQAHGSRRGNKITSEGEGEMHADVWFAPEEGVLVEYRYDDLYEGTTAVSGLMSRTIATSNETRTVLKLVNRESSY